MTTRSRCSKPCYTVFLIKIKFFTELPLSPWQDFHWLLYCLDRLSTCRAVVHAGHQKKQESISHTYVSWPCHLSTHVRVSPLRAVHRKMKKWIVEKGWEISTRFLLGKGGITDKGEWGVPSLWRNRERDVCLIQNPQSRSGNRDLHCKARNSGSHVWFWSHHLSCNARPDYLWDRLPAYRRDFERKKPNLKQTHLNSTGAK